MTPRYSIVILSKDEPRTLERAIRACIDQLQGKKEILVVSPDEAARQLVEALQVSHSFIRHIQDDRRGKPAAINQAITQAKGEIIVLTDGDVVIANNALAPLVEPFNNSKVGATSGHPIPQDARNTKYGFWAHVLTEAGAHHMRLHAQKQNKMIEASAYLMAARKDILEHIPEDALADDPVISHQIWNKGFRIVYVPEALVRVKYPDNFADWKQQKIRTTGGYQQSYLGDKKMRSFSKELGGIGRIIAFASSPKELWWTFQLIAARAYIWAASFWHIRIRKRSLRDIWQPVKSTK
jgi:cellulose synthase/poly-beta-1,6-N-acetylglucosamine synthase-like glycosyltransferase